MLSALNLVLLGCAYDSGEASEVGTVQTQSEPLNPTGAVGLSDLEEMQLYQSSQYGIEFAYPTDWTANEPSPNDAGIIVGFLAPGENIDDPAVFLLVQNEELPSGQEITLDQYSQAALDSLKEAVPDIEILVESDIDINGVPGHAVVYKLDSQGMTYRVLSAWTVVGENAYLFTFNAPDELYDQFAADAADMIDSFKAGTAVPQAEISGLWVEPAATESSEEQNQMEEENTSITY